MSWLARHHTAHEPGLCVCGEWTTETDRAGYPVHAACLQQVKRAVARESRPTDRAAERRRGVS
jgi:hypothetical protein